MADDRDLWAANTPWAFWRLLGQQGGAEGWAPACRDARACLAGLPMGSGDDLAAIARATLGEGQFGAAHWQLSRVKRLYYRVRPVLPEWVRPLLQRLAARRPAGPLNWPVEDRLVRFQFQALGRLLVASGQRSVPYVHFWPQDKRLALVLTHDVDSEHGQRFVRALADLEEEYGFRSAFNLVPQGYPVDRGLLAELRARGFEVGVHGLKHDGKLYDSEQVFLERARQINAYLKDWQAAGFRSPLMQRNPAWLQALEVEYDSSFFDTDPFEPIPGGTMSIWPFFLGRFVELPYTLPQDHTLMRSLGETTPHLWLEKVAFIRRYCGMVLVNSHPDYLRNPSYLAIYREFLARLREQGDYWQALPVEVARWWRRRQEANVVWDGSRWLAPDVPGLTVWQARLDADADPEGAAIPILEPEAQPRAEAVEAPPIC